MQDYISDVKFINIGVIMTKKLIFILLMSGVVLSPMGVYAMEEEGMPGSSISKAAPVAPISVPGLKVLPGEHLERVVTPTKIRNGHFIVRDTRTDWENKDVVLPEYIQKPEDKLYNSITIRAWDSDKYSDLTLLDPSTGKLAPFTSLTKGEEKIPILDQLLVSEFPATWKGPHHLFRVTKDGIDVFPYTSEQH